MTNRDLVNMAPWLKEIVRQVVAESFTEFKEEYQQMIGSTMDRYEKQIERSEARIAETKKIVDKQATNYGLLLAKFETTEAQYQKTIDKLIRSISASKVVITNAGIKNEVK